MSFHEKRFGRAAQTYEAHAGVQARMAETLIESLSGSVASLTLSAPHILEMGCGTGLLTRKLLTRFPESSLWATDASQAMLDEAKQNFPSTATSKRLPKFSILDAASAAPDHHTVREVAPFGMAASNALVQWFADLENHFRMVADLLSPQGIYLVSGFSRDNFPELNSVLKEHPFSFRDFPGHGQAEVDSAAKAAGFQLESWMEESVETIYPTPEAFLAAISGLGSSRRPGTEPLTQSRLIYLVDMYRARYACLGGVKATWKPWYALLRKKATAP